MLFDVRDAMDRDLRQFFEPLVKGLLRWLEKSGVRNDADRDDIVQTTRIRLLSFLRKGTRMIRSLDGNRGLIWHALRQSLSDLRTQQRRRCQAFERFVNEHYSHAGDSGQSDIESIRDWLIEVIEASDCDHRDLLYQLMQGKSQHEIATVLQLADGTLSRRVKQAIGELRAAISNDS